MRLLLAFLRDRRGASAAEFALILPLFLLFLLGIIDVGRYAWAFNQAEKATQIGARWAVTTQVIPGGDETNGLKNYNFLNAGAISGESVTQAVFGPGVTCLSNATNPVCTCKTGGTCSFDVSADSATSISAWTELVGRMNDIYPDIAPTNVVVDYDWSGLGYAGDPNGPDVSPLVTVSLRNIDFEPMFLGALGITFPIPSASYSLTMEDGQGATSN